MRLLPSVRHATSGTSGCMARPSSFIQIIRRWRRYSRSRWQLKAPKHLQRIVLRLQRYSIQVVYRKGSFPVLANTLSRAPLNIVNDASPTNFDLFRVSVERQNLQPNTISHLPLPRECSTSPKRICPCNSWCRWSQLTGLHRKHPFQSA